MPGTWGIAALNTIDAVKEDPLLFPTYRGINGIMYESGAAYDPVARRLYVRGGGHASSWVTAIYMWDFATALWSRLNDSGTCFDSLSGSPNYCSNPLYPRTPHTYGQFVFLPALGKLAQVGSSGYIPFGDKDKIVRCFDLATNQWEAPLTPIYGYGTQYFGGVTAWDYSRQRLWLHNFGKMQCWNPLTDTWEVLGPGQFTDLNLNLSQPPGARYYGAIDTQRDRLVAVGFKELNKPCGVYWDLNTPYPGHTFTPQGDLSSLEGYRSPGVIYHPIVDQFIISCGNANVYLMRPEPPWELTKVVLSPENTILPGTVQHNLSGVNGRWWWDPQMDLFFLVPDAFHTYAFRLPNAVYPLPPTPIPDPNPPEQSPLEDRLLFGSRHDERALYVQKGLTVLPGADAPLLTPYPEAPTHAFTVFNPLIHDNTEGCPYGQAHMRMAWCDMPEPGWEARKKEWRRYMCEEYEQGLPLEDPRRDDGKNFCNFYHDEAYGWDHLYADIVWDGSQEAFDAAVRICTHIETLWSTRKPERYNGFEHPRPLGRQLKAVHQLWTATRDKRWYDLRNCLLQTLNVPYTDERYKTHWTSERSTNAYVDGGYAAGLRIQSTLMLAILTEACWPVYEETKLQWLREQLIDRAYLVMHHGLDRRFDYIPSVWGLWLPTGEYWCKYADPAKGYDGSNSALCTNLLTIGYALTGDTTLRDFAWECYYRGSRAVWNKPLEQTCADGEVKHFIDTRFSDGFGAPQLYAGPQKGLLPHAWMIFCPAVWE